jgi:hypothetical protein
VRNSQKPSSTTPSTIASARKHTEVPIHRMFSSPMRNGKPSSHLEPRRSCTSVIALSMSPYHPSALASCENNSLESPVWSGHLWDKAELTDSLRSWPIKLVWGDDDTPVSRDSIVQNFQILARELGFTHCEVRDYTTADAGRYIPLYGGPLPSLRGAS